MKKRFLLGMAVVVSIIGYSFGRELASSVGIYCERPESAASKLADMQNRRARLAAIERSLAEADRNISRIKDPSKQEELSVLQQQRANLEKQRLQLQQRAHRIPSLPRTGALPFKKAIDGQQYTCFAFEAQDAQGSGWKVTKSSDQVSLALDEASGFYGLDRDQFAVDPKTLQKLKAERSSGKVLYKWHSDTGVVR